MEGRTSVTTRRRSVPKRDQPWQYLRRPSVVTSLNALLSLGIWRRQTAIFGFSPLTKHLLFINAVLIQPRVALYDTPERKKWEKTNVWRREDFSREAVSEIIMKIGDNWEILLLLWEQIKRVTKALQLFWECENGDDQSGEWAPPHPLHFFAVGNYARAVMAPFHFLSEAPFHNCPTCNYCNQLEWEGEPATWLDRPPQVLMHPTIRPQKFFCHQNYKSDTKVLNF